MDTTKIVGQNVSRYGKPLGIVLAWEPLGSGMCDVLVGDGDRRCWWSSLELTLSDGTPFPSRKEAREEAEAESQRALQAIKARWEKEPAFAGTKILAKALNGAIAIVIG